MQWNVEKLEYPEWPSTAPALLPFALEQQPDYANEPQAEAGTYTETKGDERIAVLEQRIAALTGELEQQEVRSREAIAAAREAGILETRAEARSEQAQAQLAIAARLQSAMERFHQNCEDYFAQVEHEVVRLALSIAARVLHREAQLDPLLLAGAVRVALGQLADATGIRLRVPATEEPLWTEMLRLQPNMPVRPQIVADPALSQGDCEIETTLGAIDLSVKAQLAEIERGFFDLLEKRQRTTSECASEATIGSRVTA